MKNNTGSGYGGATLVMLFSVLCMTVFAVLAYSSAKSQMRLSERYASSITEYYAADTKATLIYGGLKNADGRAFDKAADLGGDDVDISAERSGDGSELFSFSCPVNDSLSLDVKLSRKNGNWSVLSWNLTDTVEWEIDLSLPVW